MKKDEKDTNPKYATWYRSYDRTPPKGTKTIVLDEDRWVVVQWDKKEDSIVIFTPPRHESRKPIERQWLNGKFEEAEKVNIEDLARIH
jgi:hypoxanthine phosphoribosyltransferase